jgi:hypothetical protein
MTVKKLLASLLVCVAGAASSQTLVGTITSHEEQLGAFYFSDGTLGYYGQSWTTQSLGSTSAGRSIFDLEADGKLGLFDVQLVVHCQIPELLHWARCQRIRFRQQRSNRVDFKNSTIYLLTSSSDI